MNKIYMSALLCILSVPLIAVDYSVNLMWINREKNSEKMVFPEQYENRNIEADIRGWAEKNPKAPLNFWFDAEEVSPKQIANTEAFFKAINKEQNRSDDISLRLKNVHELERSKADAEVFSNKTPIYFRTDLLRLMAAVPYLKKCGDKTCYFVYADLSVEPMSEKELFDDKTMLKLGKYGAVFAKAPKTSGIGTFALENIFHIISNNKPNLIEALNKVIIDLDIARAKNAINGTLITPSVPKTAALTQLVFESIPRLFEYFYQLEGLGALKSQGVSYDKKIHGDLLLNPTQSSAKWPGTWQFVPTDLSIWDNDANEIKVPTKQVESTRKREIEFPSEDTPAVPIVG